MANDPKLRYLPETIVPITFGYGDDPVYKTVEECFKATKDDWLDSVAAQFGD